MFPTSRRQIGDRSLTDYLFNKKWRTWSHIWSFRYPTMAKMDNFDFDS